MDILTQLDPFHLVSLSEDIDLQCQRLVARQLPKIIDEKALYNLKVALREQMVSLLTEMLNEWRLAQDTVESSLFDENWIIPGVPEMASQLPYLYGLPPEGEKERKAWSIERVRWTISAWMQMWGQLFAYLPAADHTYESADKTVAPDNIEPSLIRVPNTSAVLAITRIWQMLRVLTLEYLGKKADLLVTLGKLEAGVNVKEEAPDMMTQAKEAFWGKRADAPLLLVLAMRHALFQQLNIKEQLRGRPVHLNTSILVAIASDAGLPLPHPVELLANLCFDLEECQNLGTPLELSYFYPVFRVLIQTVEHLQGMKTDAAVQARAAMIVSQILDQNFPDEPHSQS